MKYIFLDKKNFGEYGLEYDVAFWTNPVTQEIERLCSTEHPIEDIAKYRFNEICGDKYKMVSDKWVCGKSKSGKDLHQFDFMAIEV